MRVSKVSGECKSQFTCPFADFLPDCAITGMPCCNQKRLPEKREKGQFTLSLYKAAGLTQAYILIAIPGLRITTNTVANAINMSFLEAKNSGLVAIITTSFLYVDDQ